MDKQQQIHTMTTTNNDWTTREELLLSYAVRRYGFSDWDTVAVEIQSRSSLPQTFVSPHHCKLKFLELKRRFRDGEDADADAVPWLVDLRNLRVEELRREVHRYDDSILSLQLKVKRLEEERERSVEMNGNNDKRTPDLQKANDENGSENDKNERDGEVPEIIAGDANSGEKELDQEKQQSVNESNSDENQQTALNDDDTNKVREGEGEGDRSVTKKPDLEAMKEIKPERCDNSCDQSSESVARRLGVTPEDKQNKPELNNNNNSTGSRDSESELGRANAERSDVQSSASMTAKSRRCSDGAGEEFEWDRRFGAMKQVSVKSQPLVKILELIRSHKSGPLFERQLDSQVSDKFKDVVRQHMDLQKIQKRLDQGVYSPCTSKFFRDLLLLFNNAIVFFPKSSAEFIAATELQKLVVTEMSKENLRSDYSPEHSLTPNSQAQSKPNPEKPESLLDSQKISAPIIVCRKRSSIHSKSAPDSNKRRSLENEEKKTSSEVKPTSGNANNTQEQESLTNMDTKDRIVTGTRSFRRNNSCVKTSAAALKKQRNASTDVDKKDTPNTEKNNKKEKDVLTMVKKRGAADFLKRIKGSSPQDKSKGVANDSKNTRQNSSADGRKNKIILRQKPAATKEDIGSSSKRNAGGPVKKPVEPVSVKRKKEPEPSSSQRPQKRNRR